MYTVELDCHFVFSPPMDDESRGIVTTRTIKMPFPPYNGLLVHGRGWDGTDEPHGWKLEDVVWDLDREVFLATTSLTHVDLPIACIPGELMGCLGRGWKFGSYEDAYTKTRHRHVPGALAEAACALDDDSLSWDDVGHLHTRPPEDRPEAMNALMQALIRQMASTWHRQDGATAYAMEKTGRFLGAHRKLGSPESKAWTVAVAEYHRMSTEDVMAWEKRTRKYPTIESLVCKPKREKLALADAR